MSGITTGTALAIAGGLGAAGSVAGGAFGLAGANKQASAADQAAELQAQEAQNALNFQEQEWGTTQANEAPWLKAGQGAVSTLSNLLSTPGSGLTTPWTQQFTAPTAQQAEQTPGYQFQMQQGQEALQRSAAAKGNLLSGGTLKGLDQYSQGLASENYQQNYNNAFQNYLQNYNQFENNQTNLYNRYAGLAGLGQQTATALGQQGQTAANNTGSIYLTTGAQQGQDLQNAAAATASGYTSLGNSLSGGLSNLGSLGLLSSLFNNGNSGGYAPSELNV